MKAYFAEQMRKIDSMAEKMGGVPSIVLMENAAEACVRELEKISGLHKKSVAVFCGKGNNGGDGFAIARKLSDRGIETSVFLVCGSEFTGDAKINYDIIRKTDISIDVVSDTENLKYIVKSFDIIVDAIFGTGLHGTVRGAAYDVIDEINNNAKYVLSVDVPSGINSDSGEICGICVKADKTVTFAAYKVGMLMFPAADFTGEIIPVDISIPKYIFDEIEGITVTDGAFVKSVLPKRKNNSHKGDYGKLLIIAGSRGMTGAAYMASEAALRSGCGLVTLAVCESLNEIFETKTTEVMTLPLPDTDGHLSYKAADIMADVINLYDAVLIGPGLGRYDEVRAVTEKVLEVSRVPVVIDADAINVLAKNKEILSKCGCSLIFTPHTAEMSRLCGMDIGYIEENRISVSKEFAEEYGAVVILKGHHTVVTGADLMQYINITGNPGLAKGGSGDVLAGITAAFAARGLEEVSAAAAAVYVHGLAADKAVKTYGTESLAARDVIEYIPKVLEEIIAD